MCALVEIGQVKGDSALSRKSAKCRLDITLLRVTGLSAEVTGFIGGHEKKAWLR